MFEVDELVWRGGIHLVAIGNRFGDPLGVCFDAACAVGLLRDVLFKHRYDETLRHFVG
jgi:hypothetical protein